MPSVGDIAADLGFEAEGDLDIAVHGVSHPAYATPEDLALAMDRKYLSRLEEGAARAAMVPPETDWRALGLEAAILAPRARYAMAGATALFADPPEIAPGVHPSAVIDPSAEIGPDAAIGPLTVIGPRARIGARARIDAQVFIGPEAELGADALIYPGARLMRRVRIGDRVVIHANAVIGGDGFSFVTPEKGSVESAKETGAIAVGAENRVWARIHSLGAVRLGDDVEIGSGAMIDRGTVTDTRIGDGTKIDNLVQVGHNVQIGENCLLCGHVGIAGSAEIGDRVVLGGRVGVADHTSIGSDVLAMANSAIGTRVKPRSIVGGAPAVEREEYARILMATRRLPRLAEDVQALKKRLSNEERSG